MFQPLSFFPFLFQQKKNLFYGRLGASEKCTCKEQKRKQNTNPFISSLFFFSARFFFTSRGSWSWSSPRRLLQPSAGFFWRVHLAAISQVPENAPLGRLREGGGKERTMERREAQNFAKYIERSGNSRDLRRSLLLNLEVKVKAMQSPIGAPSNEPRLQRTRGSIFGSLQTLEARASHPKLLPTPSQPVKKRGRGTLFDPCRYFFTFSPPRQPVTEDQ